MTDDTIIPPAATYVPAAWSPAPQQYAPPGPQSPQTIVNVHQAPSNGMGTAGFVLSLIGFLTCGCLSPLGLLFSIIGLSGEPRGLAIAGVVLGSLGTLLMVIVAIPFLFMAGA